MIKLTTVLLFAFFLTACSSTSAEISNEEVTEELMSTAESNIVVKVVNHPENLITQTVDNQESDGSLRQAWSQYDQYAQPDEDGFAYYIHDDPDISSAIYPINDKQSEDVLLFTFDDAPNLPDSNALDIAHTLKAHDVNAVFLVNGMYLEGEEGKQIARQIHEMGFELGNHSYYHPNMRDLSYEEQYQELKNTNDLISEVTDGAPVRWFRPPFGLFDLDTINICNELGMQLITWNFGYDWMEEYQDGQLLSDVSLNNEYLRSGANILMHDLPWTSQALASMIEGYRAQGYHIVDPYLIKHQRNSTDPLQ